MQIGACLCLQFQKESIETAADVDMNKSTTTSSVLKITSDSNECKNDKGTHFDTSKSTTEK